MSVEKVRIGIVQKIEDTAGKFGPQKRIQFKDENDRMISGWIPLTAFKEEVWVTGKTVELLIEQKGNFWNFKLPTKVEKEIAKTGDEVMNALREIFKFMKEFKVETVGRLSKIEMKLNGETPATLKNHVETARDVFGDIGDGFEE